MPKRFAIAFVGMLSTAAMACPAPDPVKTANWIFSNHYFFYASGKGSAEYLSSNLLALLKADWKCQEQGGECAIDADPWLNAQDGAAAKPKFEVVSSSDKQAVVEMKYSFVMEGSSQPAENRTSRLLLTKNSSQCWVLDNLTGPDGVALASTLKDYPYDGD